MTCKLPSRQRSATAGGNGSTVLPDRVIDAAIAGPIGYHADV
jgi:hypothetical protein